MIAQCAFLIKSKYAFYPYFFGIYFSIQMSMAGQKIVKKKCQEVSYKIIVHLDEQILLTSMDVGLYSYKKTKLE